MSNFLPYPEVKPTAGASEKLVVFLHGVGSDGNDLIALAPYFSREFPTYHFISPNGVEPYDMAPFGRQWFSLYDRTAGTITSLAEKNAPKLMEIIHAKQQELALGNRDTIIIGFSQGTMIGLYSTLIQNEPFAAMIGYSGRLIPPAKCLNFATPICLIHGREDDVVPSSATEEAKEFLVRQNIKCQAYELSKLAHSIDLRGIEIAVKFLRDVGC